MALHRLRRSGLTALLFAAAGCASQQHASRGWDLLAEKHYLEAAREFKAANAGGRPLPGALIGLHKTYLGLNDLDTARQYLDEALKDFPNEKFVNFEAGFYFLRRERDCPKAVEYLKKAERLFGHGDDKTVLKKGLQEAESCARGE